MNLQKYQVEAGNKKSFIEEFKKHMDVEVKTVIVIDTLMSHVEPVGDLPIGFVLREKKNWFLVGWTDKKKRCHPQSLYPHAKKQKSLYGPWTKQTLTYRDLWKCVSTRLHQLDDFPTVVSSSTNWENNRQALFVCAKLLGDGVLERVIKKEIELCKSIMMNNPELLQSTCSNLGISNTMNALHTEVAKMYAMDIVVEEEDTFRESGTLQLVKDHALSKWNI